MNCRSKGSDHHERSPCDLPVCLTLPVLADPPAHAPAQGYRDKGGNPGKLKHRGYAGVEWDNDYGIGAGRCNTDAVLAALGAVGGAVIGNRTASPENRTVATIVGAILPTDAGCSNTVRASEPSP